MTMEATVGLSIALLVMCIGLIGSVVPGIPSTPLILAAAIGHKIYFGPESVGVLVMTLLVVVTAFSIVLDYAASMAGAKKLGATWRGAVGAVLGVIAGLFFPFPGIIIGPFAGAVVLEMVGGREWREASKAGLGATVGLLAGAVAKIGCGLGMIALFTINVIQRAG
jgi:uncharacterized protein YqgC (DUF456 family)